MHRSLLSSFSLPAGWCFHEVFTGKPGVYVSLADTIRSFKGILDGEYDDLPEAAFSMVGNIDEAVEKAKTV